MVIWKWHAISSVPPAPTPAYPPPAPTRPHPLPRNSRSGKWVVVGSLLAGALPVLTGLLVHDALRGPLPPAEETAALTWGKIWALGLVCVKVWARCGGVTEMTACKYCFALLTDTNMKW